MFGKESDFLFLFKWLISDRDTLLAPRPFVTDFKSFFGLKFIPKLDFFDFDWISYDDRLFSDRLFSDPEEDKDDLGLSFVALCLGANSFPVSSSGDFS